MIKHRRRMTRGLATLITLTALGVPLSALQAQSTQPAEADAAGAKPAQGQRAGIVTGDRVNVRSGSDRNYYPVTQLNRGDKIVVVDEEYGWYEILPPEKTYSLVEKTYLAVEEGSQTGVANEITWVKAGSEMSNRRYANQAKLRPGDKVQILGQTEDGDFYKIVPPKGATLWIHGDFVDLTGRVEAAGGPTPRQVRADDAVTVKPGELLSGTPNQTVTMETTNTSPTTQPVLTGTSTVDLSPDEIDTTPIRSPGETIEQNFAVTQSIVESDQANLTQSQMEIKAIEAEIEAEKVKPFREQSYDSIIARLEALAAREGDEEEITRRYANARLMLIRRHLEVINALISVRSLTTTAISAADEKERERSRIRAAEAIPADRVVVEGEVQASTIYRGEGSRPKRWRIVERPEPSRKTRDVDVPATRTIAYIELPPGSTLNPSQYIGKYVGIRASQRRYLRDAIPPIPIYTVENIVDMADRRFIQTPTTRPAGSGSPIDNRFITPAAGTSRRAVEASPDNVAIVTPLPGPAESKPSTSGSSTR